jgi:xanthine dehydrogenase YagS FAD-binding subunit
MSAPFGYLRVSDSAEAVTEAAVPGSLLLAGGTTLVDLIRLGVMAPARLVDVNRLPLDKIEQTPAGLSIGALARNSDTAYHPLVRAHFPALSEALLSGASPQLRNMATTAGNLMQRTRCPYFRDVGVTACNKRTPGSGCAAYEGYARQHAILGGGPDCIAVHPSDMCVALVALDAIVHVRGQYGAGPDGATAAASERQISIAGFHLLPGSTPDRETSLAPGELITHVTLPTSPLAARSRYVKARDRASYAFALASTAAAVQLEGGRIRAARVALGGVATKPWRSAEAERALVGREATRATFEAAAAAALADARTRPDNRFKVDLARATIVRALERSLEAA